MVAVGLPPGVLHVYEPVPPRAPMNAWSFPFPGVITWSAGVHESVVGAGVGVGEAGGSVGDGVGVTGGCVGVGVGVGVGCA